MVEINEVNDCGFLTVRRASPETGERTREDSTRTEANDNGSGSNMGSSSDEPQNSDVNGKKGSVFDRVKQEVNNRIEKHLALVLAWKPSSRFWRIFQLIDNLFYLLAWPFFIVSWCAYLGFCLSGFGLPLSPIFAYSIGMCAKLSYWGFVSLLVGVVFQLTVPFTMWKSFFDYHMLIAKYRRDDRGMFSMFESAKSLVTVILPLMILQGLFFAIPKLFHLPVSSLPVSSLTFWGVLGFCKTAVFGVVKWGMLGLFAFGILGLVGVFCNIAESKKNKEKLLFLKLKRDNFRGRLEKTSSETLKVGKNKSQMQDSKTSDEELYREGSLQIYNADLDIKLDFICSSVFATAFPYSAEGIIEEKIEREDADLIGQPGGSDSGRGAGMDY